MSEVAVRTMGLGRQFGVVRALDDLTLEIPRGIIFGFLGPNGSGKTTTIRLLLGLLEPSAGRAEVLGFDTRTQADAIRERSGALLEHCGLYERLSAEENLDLYGRFWRMPGDERRARVKEMLTRLELWDRRREVVAGWSRGMKQKLAVARALLHRPALIFLDEPSAGLDPLAAAALREELARLASEEGVTVFLTTHNLSEAERLCALVGVVRAGRLLALAPPSELRAHSDSPRVEIVGSNLTETMRKALAAREGVLSLDVDGRRIVLRVNDPSVIPAIVAWLVSGGFQVEQVRTGESSLEETFVALMEEPA